MSDFIMWLDNLIWSTPLIILTFGSALIFCFAMKSPFPDRSKKCKKAGQDQQHDACPPLLCGYGQHSLRADTRCGILSGLSNTLKQTSDEQKRV